ncbi:MAG TPA: hypothetical protein PLD47_13705 [Aggregatilineales bacterium]|nr:hypothetical protein [Anaerolineales bacterium]HRE48776.1 hypothetical protein [Aggregatilineales bacterium]
MDDPNNEFFDLLGVEPGALTITAVTISGWGTELTIDGEYEGDQPFQCLFEEVSSLQWDAYHEPDDNETTVSVVGVFVGEDDHRAAALVYTDLFELSILYGTLSVVKL